MAGQSWNWVTVTERFLGWYENWDDSDVSLPQRRSDKTETVSMTINIMTDGGLPDDFIGSEDEACTVVADADSYSVPGHRGGGCRSV